MTVADVRIDAAAGHEWFAASGQAAAGVSPPPADPELFEEHLRPAWHVVVATVVVLAAAALTSWLGH